MKRRARLLVSVRNAAEARAATWGGAHVIDIKDPNQGPLGAAIESWPEVILACDKRSETSAALGELHQWRAEQLPNIPSQIGWIKIGLAGQNGQDWQAEWAEIRCRLPEHVASVVVAYADWQCCDGPPLEDVVTFAVEHAEGLLIDTYEKNGACLWDFLSTHQAARIRQTCHSHQIPLALAGSLDLPAAIEAARCGCDWVAVRGAACEGGRQGTVTADRVRALREAI